MVRLPVKIVIFDFDNTLYDWVGFFVPSMVAMINEAAKITSIESEKIFADLRSVHQKHHDTEHPFSLLEAKCIKEYFSGYSNRELKQILDPAFHKFNKVRNEKLKLYDGVLDLLKFLRSNGVTIIGHTEGRLASVQFRVQKLGISHYFDRIFCRKPVHSYDSSVMPGLEGKIAMLPAHDKKPNPDVLVDICSIYRVSPSNAVYVGDSLAKDMVMANEVGSLAVWAKYGTHHDPGLYETLVKLSHWTADDVEFENNLKERAKSVVVDITLECSPIELKQNTLFAL